MSGRHRQATKKNIFAVGLDQSKSAENSRKKDCARAASIAF
jgi:hypothetical protein